MTVFGANSATGRAISAQTLRLLFGVILACAAAAPVCAQTVGPDNQQRGVSTAADAPTRQHLVTRQARQEFDVGRYSVRKPGASFFDVAARRQTVRTTQNPQLQAAAEGARHATTCAQLKALPVLDAPITLPPLTVPDRVVELAREPLRTFAQTASRLAGRHVATTGKQAGAVARCLTEALARWADANRENTLRVGQAAPGALIELQKTLSSVTLAYSIVDATASEMVPTQAERVEAWLAEASRAQLDWPLGGSSCCDSIYYLRSLHATAAGVVANDDQLLQQGVRALRTALAEMRPDGSLPRERAHGHRAFALQFNGTGYLVMIGQLLERQGYDVSSIRSDGAALSDLVSHAQSLFRNPLAIYDVYGRPQRLDFMRLSASLAWFEAAGTAPYNGSLAELMVYHRPAFNSDLGGFLTLYFFKPAEWSPDDLRPRRVMGTPISAPEHCGFLARWQEERDTDWRVACEAAFHQAPPDPKVRGSRVYGTQRDRQNETQGNGGAL